MITSVTTWTISRLPDLWGSGDMHTHEQDEVDADKTRLLNFYFPGGFEKAITEFGVPATSRTLPPAEMKQSETPEQMQALFQRVGMSPVALPDSLRSPE